MGISVASEADGVGLGIDLSTPFNKLDTGILPAAPLTRLLLCLLPKQFSSNLIFPPNIASLAASSSQARILRRRRK